MLNHYGPSPDFIVLGAQKAGGTWLRARLDEHPDIFMAKGETRFFLGNDTIMNYTKRFRPGKTNGEITPEYLWLAKDCVRRIEETFSGIRMIAILRNPIDRAFSQWKMARHLGNMPLDQSFRDLFDKDSNGLFSRGCYYNQIMTFWDHFPVSKLGIWSYDAMCSDPAKFLEEIHEFVGVKPVGNEKAYEWLHFGYHHSQKDLLYDPTDRRYVVEAYHEEIVKLQGILNFQLDWR